jgi:hemolysin D
MVTSIDFAPDLLRIQQEAPAPLPRAILVGTSALFFFLVTWAAIAKLDVIASGEGRLVPATFVKPIQAIESGVVKTVLVKEGASVTAGQLLLKLEPAAADFDLGWLKAEESLRAMQLERIRAELADQPLVFSKSYPTDLQISVQAQFNARRQSLQDSLAIETAALNRARSELRAAEQILEKFASTLPILQKASESFNRLKQEGFVGEVAANEKLRELKEREKELSAQEANVTSFKSAVSQAESKLSTIRSSYRAQLETERAELLSQVNKLKGDIGKSAIRYEAHNIYSPHSGIVKDLTVTSRGAVIAAGTTLMMIVPKEDPLQAEVSLRNEDIGFIEVGAPVKIKVATYPFQKYGLLDGKVVSISADSVDPKQAALNGVPQLTYKAIVSLATQTLESKAQAASLGLSSGMLIAAEIHLNRRTVLEYLISPVQKLAAEAARER